MPAEMTMGRRPTASCDSKNAADLSRRGLFGASGSLLAAAVTAGLAAPSLASAAAEPAAVQTPPAKVPTVFDLEHMPIDPDSGAGSVQMARQKQFPFMSGATVARVVMKPN